MLDSPILDPRVAPVLVSVSEHPFALVPAWQDREANLDTLVATERANLRKAMLSAIDRLAGVTGLEAGPGANKLCDELIDVMRTEVVRQVFLLHAEEAVSEPLPPELARKPDADTLPQVTEPAAREALRNIPDPAALVTYLDQWDADARPGAAKVLLRFAPEEGASYEVLQALRAIAGGAADALGEGIEVAIFPEGEALPSPGEVVELSEHNAVKAGHYFVVGFGPHEQTLRVRPPRDDELLGDAVGQVGASSTYQGVDQ